MMNYNKEKIGALCLIGAGIFLSFGGTLNKIYGVCNST
jgi:hypothetical protein